MPARKMRVEVFDSGGNRYTITFEGHVTREKALRLLDLVELLGGMPNPNPELITNNPGFTKFARLRLLIEKRFPIVWFSSKEAQSVYEEELKEPISLSTVSTYLSRMVGRGVLVEGGTSNRHRFKVATGLTKSTLNFIKSNKTANKPNK